MPKTYSRLFVALFLLFSASSAGAQEASLTPEQIATVGAWLADAGHDAAAIDAMGLPQGFTAEQAKAARNELWSVYQNNVNDKELGDIAPTITELVQQANGGRISLEARAMTLGEVIMPYIAIRKETQAPQEAGRALFICTHGGGRNDRVDGPHAWDVNTREWQTQVSLAIQAYAPEGIYFVPRMADDRMGRWWHKHNQDAFERVAQQAIAHWGVDPNRVYLLGISEGGYGTDILAPFMPDRFGGANAMAAGVDQGNPPENLRNLAFRTDVGENDTTFNRVGLAVAFHEALEKLHAKDPAGYTNSINVQPGRGHGIDYRPGVEWIAGHRRTPWPEKIVWTGKKLDGRRRHRMYWVQVDGEIEAPAIRVVADANRKTNAVNINAELLNIVGDGGNPTHAGEGDVTKSLKPTGITIRVLLHDDLLDLDKPVQVTCNGEVVFEGRVQRSTAVQLRTLADYGDPAMTASAEVLIPLD